MNKYVIGQKVIIKSVSGSIPGLRRVGNIFKIEVDVRRYDGITKKYHIESGSQIFVCNEDEIMAYEEMKISQNIEMDKDGFLKCVDSLNKPNPFYKNYNQNDMIDDALKYAFPYYHFSLDKEVEEKLRTTVSPIIKGVWVNNIPSKVFYNDKKKATTLMYGNQATVVKCGKGDKYNRRVGFLEAYFQATCGMSKNKALKYLNEIVKDKENKKEK